MKKILFSLVVLSLLIGGFSVLAQDNTLPSPGLTPDSPFYFLKVWKEQIQLFFTFGAENKTKQYLHLSDIRLAEYQKMIEKGKTEIAQKTLDKYEKQLNRAIEITEELKNKGKDVKDISQRLEDTVGKHISVLEQNLQKVPESGKKGIENAIEKSSKVLEKFKEKEITCVNKCGDGKCDEVVCIAVGCPCPETKENCPQDCKEEIVKPTCQDECSQVGLKRCYNVGNYGYQTCGDYDSDDCLEWSSTTICPPDTITCQNGICIQQGQKEQKCSDGTPYNQCSTNKPSYCENGNLINKCSTCGCPSGKQCQSNGGCTVSTQTTCQNECSEVGLKRCSGNGYQACGNYDADTCLEWSTITNCPVNTICQDGLCTQQKQQEQKCSDGTLYGQCSTNKPKYCDNGNLISKCATCGCPSGQQCQTSGSCITIQATCQDECSSTGLKRCSNNGYQICGNYDTDDCLEWGLITDCPPNTICQNGSCISTCLDGTPYRQCSTDKPKYCDNGILINKCSICGCYSGGQCQSDESCFFTFTIKTYSLSELKIAYVELEAANSIGIEVTKENILPFFLKFKEYIEGTSNGKTMVNSDYIILPKEIASIQIIGAGDPNLSPILDQITKKYENTYIGYTLVVIIDAPFLGYVGANYDRSNKLHTVALALGDFYDSQSSLYREFIYIMAHEILHSFNQAYKIVILDAYYIFDETKLPKLNSRYQDLHGGYQEVYPFGASLVKLGWKNYNIIELEINSPIQFVVENSCIPTSKINKIPLGYVNLDGEWLLKSIIVELRGFSDCKLDKYLTPGVNLHYIYENSDVVKYSYPIPVTLPNYYFALHPTNHYYDDEGHAYFLPDVNDEKRLAEFSGPEFDFKILDEKWVNKQGGNTDPNRLTIHDRFISSTVQLTIKQFSEIEIPY